MKQVNGWVDISIRGFFASSVPGDWGTDGTPENGVPVLRSTNFRNNGSIDYSDIAYRQIKESRLSSRRIGRGTILIEKSGGSPSQAAGRVVYCDRDFNGTASNFIEVVRVKHDFSSRYVAFLLHHLYQTGLVLKYQQQTTGIINFKLNQYVEETVKYPASKNEQTKIAEVLSAVDRAIEQTEASIAKQQRIKTGLMQDLLTRGIDEHGNLRSEVTHEFKDSPLGRIPVEWYVTTIGEQFERRVERGKPDLPIMSVVMNDGLVERASVARRVESNLLAEGHALVLEGDIAYNMMRMWQGVLGRASFDCLVSPAYVVLKPRDSVDTRFAEWLFRDKSSILKFRRASRGVVDDRLRLYAHDLFAIEFAFPKSLDEQHRIAGILDAYAARIHAEEAYRDKLKLQKKGLMQDLLTGEKRVTPLLKAEQASGSTP